MTNEEILQAAKVTAKAIAAASVSLFTIGASEVAISKLRKKNRELVDNISGKEKQGKELTVVTQELLENKKIEIVTNGGIVTAGKEIKKLKNGVINTIVLGATKSLESLIHEEQKINIKRNNGHIHRIIDDLHKK